MKFVNIVGVIVEANGPDEAKATSAPHWLRRGSNRTRRDKRAIRCTRSHATPRNQAPSSPAAGFGEIATG